MSLRLALVFLVVATAPALAEDDLSSTAAPKPTTFDMAQDAAFAPSMQPANNTSDVRAFAVSNYNRTTRDTTLDLVGELGVYKNLHLVLRVDNVATHGRPGVGGAYQFLTEAKNGVSSTAYLVYKTEGFTEVEGEIEGLVAFGKTFGAVSTVLNIGYGQDADAKERDGEVAFHAHVPVATRVLVGVTGTYRDALGSGGDLGVLRDAFGGFTGTVVAGPVAVTAMAGIAGLQTMGTSGMTAGPSVTLAVGTGF
jgi:hypothetical protein